MVYLTDPTRDRPLKGSCCGNLLGASSAELYSPLSERGVDEGRDEGRADDEFLGLGW